MLLQNLIKIKLIRNKKRSSCMEIIWTEKIKLLPHRVHLPPEDGKKVSYLINLWLQTPRGKRITSYRLE